MRGVNVFTAVVSLCLVAGGALGAGADWGTDFEAARKAAVEGKKLILADFTGSDWCPWCIKLDSEVFQKDAFKTFAKESLVLFVADFPNEKQLPKDLAEKNRKLAEKYDVKGFPTVLLLDADGKVLARTGYRRGGAESYVEHLKSLMKDAKSK